MASCTTSSASAGTPDNHRANRYAASKCGKTCASKRARFSSMDAKTHGGHILFPVYPFFRRRGMTGRPMASMTGRQFRGRFAETAPDKLRGGYYTSAPVAAWLCEWAIRARTDTVLEPSCGDGVFLEAAAKRLIDLGARRSSIPARLA